MRRVLTPGKLALAGLAVLAALALVLYLAPAGDSYIFLPDEAHPAEPLVKVEGQPERMDPGGIYFVDVIVRRATLLERLVPGIREGASIVPEEAFNPTGVDERERRQSSLRVMSRSQQIAAAVALREAGYDVEARSTGVYVSEVFAGTPSAGRILPSDVIVEVEGRAVRTPEGLRAVLGRFEPGDPVEVELRRGETRRTVTIRLAESPQEPGRGFLGVLVEQAVEIELPLEVEIDAGNVGGPSAGLAFALAVLEDLGRDVDRGKRVAVTGELRLDGSVGAVGGIKQKTIGARNSDADVFVVPAGDNAEEARRHAGDLRVVAVRNFQQALRALATAVS